MHIPIRVDYGVRALVDLAVNPEERPVRASEISKRTAIPEPFLAQVLHSLSKKGLIRSQRGPHGGHSLDMAPSDIRLSMVMACLGGTVTVVGCLDDIGMCVHVPACAQREVWRSVDEAIFNILDSTTIADLVERTRAINLDRRQKKSPERIKVVVG